MKKILQFSDDYLSKFVKLVLVIIVAIIIVIALLNIVLRWFGEGLMFADPFIRHLVFILAFLGSFVAIDESKNISIDVLKKLLQAKSYQKGLIWSHRLVLLTSSSVCLWLAQSSLTFVNIELEYPRELFFGINTGMMTCVIPTGFILLGIKFFLKLVLHFFDPVIPLNEGQSS